MQNRTVKQIILFKIAINCLFNDIWFYLIIGCFDWKIGVFQIKKDFPKQPIQRQIRLINNKYNLL